MADSKRASKRASKRLSVVQDEAPADLNDLADEPKAADVPADSSAQESAPAPDLESGAVLTVVKADQPTRAQSGMVLSLAQSKLLMKIFGKLLAPDDLESAKKLLKALLVLRALQAACALLVLALASVVAARTSGGIDDLIGGTLLLFASGAAPAGWSITESLGATGAAMTLAYLTYQLQQGKGDAKRVASMSLGIDLLFSYLAISSFSAVAAAYPGFGTASAAAAFDFFQFSLFLVSGILSTALFEHSDLLAGLRVAAPDNSSGGSNTAAAA